ncbi:ankyrin repeat domain-containing protein [Streptomyces sp. BRA346]|uniref:ankyrin repeat domain-containing protein n=1 Tax=Streptomyces sp. BRA346 TaxID=2878199 RepID=UPI0040646870
MLASAAPPHQEEAYAILELPPLGTSAPAARALLRAAASGDPAALRTAIGEGADADTLDEYGAAPLHHAVASRTPAAVDALLAAGADPRAQSSFGNAPQFATAARRVDGDEHWSILWSLLDAGADINAANTAGQTLLDLAIRSDPYPERQIHLLLDRGAAGRVATVGYYEHELSGDYLVGLVDLMLSHGVRDRPGTDGRTARESALHHVAHGLTHLPGGGGPAGRLKPRWRGGVEVPTGAWCMTGARNPPRRDGARRRSTRTVPGESPALGCPVDVARSVIVPRPTPCITVSRRSGGVPWVCVLHPGPDFSADLPSERTPSCCSWPIPRPCRQPTPSHGEAPCC